MAIIIGGDVCPTDGSRDAFKTLNGEKLFGSAVELMRKADTTIVNLECALTDTDGAIIKKGPNLKGEPIFAKALKDAGINICGLANNHVFDFGSAGLRDTVKALSDNGIKYTSVGENEKEARRPLYFDDEGKRIALVTVAEHEYSYALPDKLGVWGFDPFETISDIADAKKNCDRVIVLYHGGKEQSEFPSPMLRKACRAMVRAGADIVLCQHSHCIGAAEYYENGYILYGQGNFNFVKYSSHPQWGSGLMLDIHFTERPIVNLHPIKVLENSVTLATGEEHDAILANFLIRCEILKDEQKAHAEWLKFCDSYKEQYINSVLTAGDGTDGEPVSELFAHYLDCEAHTDVWRELFRTRHSMGTDEQ